MLTCKLRVQLFKSDISQKLLQTVRLHSVSNIKNAPQSSSAYIPVYSFPYIRVLAIAHKAKVYQSAATCIGIPVSIALSIANVCSTEVCSGIAAFGISGCLLLHTFGFLTSNTVGVIYLHKDERTSKISYLDAWGSRRDIEIDLKDIIPFSDQPTAITDPLYLKLKQYRSNNVYKMNVKYGLVLNTKKFEVIFQKHTSE